LHIAEMLVRRPVPAAGVFLTLTRRCPLSCAHCSTNSMMSSEQHDAEIFRRFVRSFTAEDHPELVWLTGGEPLLRPQLVLDLVATCHAVGTRVALITGMYFARADGQLPAALGPALLAVDHVIVSQDWFHEVQVPRTHAFATVGTLLDAGQDVSFQVVGRDDDDPYLLDLTADIRSSFAGRVPALVATLAAVGRGRELLAAAQARPAQSQPVPAPADGAAPCTVAAWPVVTSDGTIVACCQQEVIEGPAPAHLRLGHASGTGWPEVAAELRRRPTLRALRTVGPEELARLAGRTPNGCGYCRTCIHEVAAPAVAERADALVQSGGFPIVEDEVTRMQVAAGPEYFARRYGIARYAPMMSLGLAPAESSS